MDVFYFVSRYFWLIAIVVTSINVAIFKQRSRNHIPENPELAEGYARLFRGYLTWLNAPWVIMGIGSTVGGVPSVWHYFRPKDGDPYVLAWFASVFLLWILGTYWLFFKGGAEMLVKHPGAIITASSPALVKLFWVLCLAAGVFAVIMMLTHDLPLPLCP
ncbi:hypothetical protein MYX65_05680 [Acidobacteria bacterium AH-259-L09]|nr:hypothetical protein [Acidobacteria bacterium AH-259-L09]